MLNCDTCSPMIFHGLTIRQHSLEYYFTDGIAHVKALYWGIAIVTIIETNLKIHASMQDKIATETAGIILISSTIILERSISFRIDKHFKITNSLIQCPVGRIVQRKFAENYMIYECNPTCEGNTKYSLQSGSLTLSEEPRYRYGYLDTVYLSQAYFVHPLCFPCPLGGKCKDGIQTLPDYWGYKVDNQSVSMIRCPDGYCCQGNETCKGINSGSTGRTGTLCGRCKQNLTEALFTSKCIPTESCRSGVVIAIHISAVIIYAVALLSFSTIKDLVIKLLKRIYTMCKERSQQDKVKTK